jgi:hypothetical protein
MLQRERILALARRASKPAAFLTVVALLFFFSQVSVTYTMTRVFYPLPDTARSRVMVTSINGASMTAPGNSLSEDGSTEAEPITFQTSNLTNNEALMQSDAAQVEGCNTEFRYDVNISFTAANELIEETKGTANVTVYNNDSGSFLASQLLALDFKPGAPTTATVSFNLATPEADPIFLVRVTFPTYDQLGAVRTTMHLRLFEYLLLKGGLLDSRSLTAYGGP